ncbi:MAG TPA: hypothetical protein VHU83_07710 [Bryobacteraceae bacterium]|jgi:hypothetical protein|nr:hypothetical protein [Bryobacteraceae bacterium]
MAKQNKQSDPIEGVVEHLNFAKNGEPNGAVLDSGYFVHMKPRAAHAIGLRIGQALQVQGKLKLSGSGGQKVIEADTVNGIDVASARSAKKKPAAKNTNAAKKATPAAKRAPVKKSAPKKATAKQTRRTAAS